MVESPIIEQFKQATLLLCPACKTAIPEIQFLPKEQNLSLEIKCKCSSQSYKDSLTNYLKKLRELYFDNENPLIDCCSQHKNYLYTKYCIDCNKKLCNECLKLHQNQSNKHNLSDRDINLACEHKCIKCEICLKHIQLLQTKSIDNSINLFNENQTKIQKLFDRNEKYYQDFIQVIDERIQTFVDLKNSIKNAYDNCTKQIEEIKDLCSIIRATQELIEIDSPYSFIKFYESFTVNDCDIVDLSQWDDLYSRRDFLSMTFKSQILKKSDKVEINFISKELKKEDISAITFLQNDGFAYSTYDKYIKLTDSSLEKKKTFKAHTRNIIGLIQLTNGNLVSTGEDFKLMFWDIKTQNCLKTIDTNNDLITSLAELQDSVLISGSKSGIITLWDTSNYQSKRIKYSSSLSIRALIELNGSRLVIGCEDKITVMMTVWDKGQLFAYKSFKGHEVVTALNQFNDGRLYSGGMDMLIKIWETQSFNCLHVFEVNCKNVYAIINNNREGKKEEIKLMTVSSSCSFKFFNIDNGIKETVIEYWEYN